MNNEMRKRIDAVMKDIEATAKAREEIDALIATLNEKISDYKESFTDIATAIEEMKDEEQEKFDNLSEGLQAGQLGQGLEASVAALESAYDIVGNFENVEDIEIDWAETDELVTALDEAKYAG